MSCLLKILSKLEAFGLLFEEVESIFRYPVDHSSCSLATSDSILLKAEFPYIFVKKFWQLIGSQHAYGAFYLLQRNSVFFF